MMSSMPWKEVDGTAGEGEATAADFLTDTTGVGCGTGSGGGPGDEHPKELPVRRTIAGCEEVTPKAMVSEIFARGFELVMSRLECRLDDSGVQAEVSAVLGLLDQVPVEHEKYLALRDLRVWLLNHVPIAEGGV